jgi:hypothetical protein
MSTISQMQIRDNDDWTYKQTKNNTFDHFPNMQDHLEKYPNFVFQTENYVTEICSVIKYFGNRFCDFQKMRTVVD